MWSKLCELFNPYEALAINNDNALKDKNGAKKCVLSLGTNVYDFFILPTIRYNSDGYISFLTVGWLRWYAGIKIYKNQRATLTENDAEV